MSGDEWFANTPTREAIARGEDSFPEPLPEPDEVPLTDEDLRLLDTADALDRLKAIVDVGHAIATGMIAVNPGASDDLRRAVALVQDIGINLMHRLDTAAKAGPKRAKNAREILFATFDPPPRVNGRQSAREDWEIERRQQAAAYAMKYPAPGETKRAIKERVAAEFKVSVRQIEIDLANVRKAAGAK